MWSMKRTLCVSTCICHFYLLYIRALTKPELRMCYVSVLAKGDGHVIQSPSSRSWGLTEGMGCHRVWPLLLLGWQPLRAPKTSTGTAKRLVCPGAGSSREAGLRRSKRQGGCSPASGKRGSAPGAQLRAVLKMEGVVMRMPKAMCGQNILGHTGCTAPGAGRVTLTWYPKRTSS